MRMDLKYLPLQNATAIPGDLILKLPLREVMVTFTFIHLFIFFFKNCSLSYIFEQLLIRTIFSKGHKMSLWNDIFLLIQKRCCLSYQPYRKCWACKAETQLYRLHYLYSLYSAVANISNVKPWIIHWIIYCMLLNIVIIISSSCGIIIIIDIIDISDIIIIIIIMLPV